MENFTFKKSWTYVAEYMTNPDRIHYYLAILGYALNDIKDDCGERLNKALEPVYKDIERQKRMRIILKENGSKGGAPIGNSNARKQPKNNQETTKIQPKNNQKIEENANNEKESDIKKKKLIKENFIEREIILQDNINREIPEDLTHAEVIPETNQPKKTLEQRAYDFRVRVCMYSGKYDSEMLKDFYDYWIEHNENGNKMRFEMEKVFDMGRRLGTWSRNNKNRYGRGSNFGSGYQQHGATDEDVNRYVARKLAGEVL